MVFWVPGQTGSMIAQKAFGLPHSAPNSLGTCSKTLESIFGCFLAKTRVVEDRLVADDDLELIGEHPAGIVTLVNLCGNGRFAAGLGDLERIQQAELIPIAVHRRPLFFDPDFRHRRSVEPIRPAHEHDLD